MLPAGAGIHGVQLTSQGLIKTQMSENTDPLGIPVSVRIDKWLDGKYGRFAYAKVLTPEAPTAEAVFNPKKFQAEPPLREAFDCGIKQVGARWQVVSVASEPKPVEKELRGCVESSAGSGNGRSWVIKLAPESGSGQATLTTKVLRAARFAHVECGQELTFIALSSNEREWVITSLLSPKVAEVVEASNPEDRYLAFAMKDWNEGADAKTVIVAVHAPPSKIWPLVYVKTPLLTNQTIRSVHMADLGSSQTINAAPADLAEAAKTLQCGTADELADLCIYCLQLTLKWDAQQRWNVGRLTGPLSLREPEKGEIIEWVQACVTEVKPLDPVVELPEVSADDGADAEKSPAFTRSPLVWMKIDDPRLGRGRISGYLKADLIAAAGLVEGVQTIVRLAGNPPYWNIKRLYRSTPLREEV